MQTDNNTLHTDPINGPLVQYVLHLADTALILGHRNSEWCGHGPVLEQDIAISNIALDLVGQARMLYQYAAEIINKADAQRVATEDTLAYLRDATDFRNLLLAEQQNGDWAVTILRQFFCSTWQYYVYTQLAEGKDTRLTAIAVKALKEVAYHIKWSAEWVIRLGDGTAESHKRLVQAVEQLWPFTGEMFMPVAYEKEGAAAGWAANISVLQQPWLQKVTEVFQEACVTVSQQQWQQVGGKTGVHTELLGFLLAEMQFMQRAYPDSEW